jgi:hypothetical protein
MFMMRIETDNDDFAGDDRGDALQHAVSNAMDDIAHGRVRGKVFDRNGNTRSCHTVSGMWRCTWARCGLRSRTLAGQRLTS